MINGSFAAAADFAGISKEGGKAENNETPAVVDSCMTFFSLVSSKF